MREFICRPIQVSRFYMRQLSGQSIFYLCRVYASPASGMVVYNMAIQNDDIPLFGGGGMSPPPLPPRAIFEGVGAPDDDSEEYENVNKGLVLYTS